MFSEKISFFISGRYKNSILEFLIISIASSNVSAIGWPDRFKDVFPKQGTPVSLLNEDIKL